MAITDVDKAKILSCVVSFLVANNGKATTNELWYHFLECKLPMRREYDRRTFTYILNQASKDINKKRWNIRQEESATESKTHTGKYYLEKRGIVYE